MQWIAQIFGFFAITSSLIIYQQNTRKQILVWKIMQDISWFTHYFILACYSAAATSFLCIIRAFVFYHNDTKLGKSRLWLPLFILLYAISAVLTWENIYSILPAISSSLSAVAFWIKNPRYTKIIAIFAALCTLGYNMMLSHSVSVYVGVTFTITSALTSLLRSAKTEKPN